jgi:hypothetical protein
MRWVVLIRDRLAATPDDTAAPFDKERCWQIPAHRPAMTARERRGPLVRVLAWQAKVPQLSAGSATRRRASFRLRGPAGKRRAVPVARRKVPRERLPRWISGGLLRRNGTPLETRLRCHPRQPAVGNGAWRHGRCRIREAQERGGTTDEVRRLSGVSRHAPKVTRTSTSCLSNAASASSGGAAGLDSSFPGAWRRITAARP